MLLGLASLIYYRYGIDGWIVSHGELFFKLRDPGWFSKLIGRFDAGQAVNADANQHTHHEQ